MANLISGILLLGVAASALLIAAGFAASFAVGWQGSLFGASSADASLPPSSFADLLARLFALEPLAITQLGLIVLLATPVVRVAASVFAFAAEGDRLYVAITAAVLAILLTSIFFLR